MSPRERLRVLVAGMVGGVPGQGGAVWAVLQWVLGLRELGHEVHLVEEVDALRPDRRAAFNGALRVRDLEGVGTLLAPHGSTDGLAYDELVRFARGADVVLNLAGTLRDAELLEPAPCRVYLDLDPVFTQLWHGEYGIDVGLEGHTHFVTVGLEIGRRCRVPTCGREWLHTLPPVCLSRWEVGDSMTHRALTTVANWRGYGSLEHEGQQLGQKAHSWRELMDFPSRVRVPVRPALAIHPGEEADVAALASHGWDRLDPGEVAGTPSAYHRFVRGSWAELGVAKSGYVLPRSGWFSDRSACYLAAGRPVVAQDTGWSAHLPHGEGLFAFADTEAAAAAVEELERRYGHHRLRAREIAEEHFDSRHVVGSLLSAVGSSGGSGARPAPPLRGGR